MGDDLKDPGVEAQIFRSASGGYDEGVIVLWLNVGGGGVEDEVVSSFLGVSLVTLEVVDGGADELAGLLIGADGVNGVTNHLKSLERHHDFVVFYVVADKHKQLCSWPCSFHGESSFYGSSSRWR